MHVNPAFNFYITVISISVYISPSINLSVLYMSI